VKGTRPVNQDGFSDDTVRTVSENGTVLKLDQHGFESS
jgi:hypothetical protein